MIQKQTQDKHLRYRIKLKFKPSPVLDILEATFTVSPNTLKRGMVEPTMPAAHGPILKMIMITVVIFW